MHYSHYDSETKLPARSPSGSHYLATGLSHPCLLFRTPLQALLQHLEMQVSNWRSASLCTGRGRPSNSGASQAKEWYSDCRASQDGRNTRSSRSVPFKVSSQRSAEHVPGKMTVQLPPYMTLSHNKETNKASLSILDREERKQREMWGTSISMLRFPTAC